MDLGAPAPWAAPEDVGVVEEAIEECSDGGGVAEELDPLFRDERHAERVLSEYASHGFSTSPPAPTPPTPPAA